MKWGISSLEELEAMKEKMDQAWQELFEEHRGKDAWINPCFEKFPKCEGTKRSVQPRARKTTLPA